VRLRAVTPADAPELAAIYAPLVRDTAISFETEAPSADEMRERIVAIGEWRPWLVAEDIGDDADAVLGYAYASEFAVRAAYRWAVFTTVYVAPDAQRRGVARALYEALFGILDALGYRRAFAWVTLPNDPSLALHRALGFTDAGIFHRAGFKLGAWHDVAMLERSLGDGDPAPPEGEPRSIRMLTPDRLAAALRTPDR
jgi:L-amino acid N-acyltransferase YncA